MDDPLFELPEFGRATRGNVRAADRALAVGKTHFKAMPEPGSADRVEAVDAIAFLETVAQLRDVVRNQVGDPVPAIEAARQASRRRTNGAIEDLHARKRQIDRSPAQAEAVAEYRRRVRAARRDTGEMIPLEEGAVEHPINPVPRVAA